MNSKTTLRSCGLALGFSRFFAVLYTFLTMEEPEEKRAVNHISDAGLLSRSLGNMMQRSRASRSFFLVPEAPQQC